MNRLDVSKEDETRAAVARHSPFGPDTSRWATAAWGLIDLAVIGICLWSLGLNQTVVALVIASITLGMQYVPLIHRTIDIWWRIRAWTSRGHDEP